MGFFFHICKTLVFQLYSELCAQLLCIPEDSRDCVFQKDGKSYRNHLWDCWGVSGSLESDP